MGSVSLVSYNMTSRAGLASNTKETIIPRLEAIIVPAARRAEPVFFDNVFRTISNAIRVLKNPASSRSVLIGAIAILNHNNLGYRDLISDLHRGLGPGPGPDDAAKLRQLIDGIRAILRLALIRVLSGLSRRPNVLNFVLWLLATSRCYGHRTEPSDYTLPVLASMSVVTGEAARLH